MPHFSPFRGLPHCNALAQSFPDAADDRAAELP
jgi:hypothetical protein